MISIAQMFQGNKWEGCETPDHVSDDIYRLSEILGKQRPEMQAHGLLGGEYGYGQHFANDTFEMHPFFWGDCECGFDERCDEWEKTHPHAPECYQTVLDALRVEKERACGYGRSAPTLIPVSVRHHPEEGVTVTELVSTRRAVSERDIREAERAYEAGVVALCKERGLTYPNGSEVHCTCSRDADHGAWMDQNDHVPTCGKVLPNFRHKRTNLEVFWYKWIGRGSTMNITLDPAAWRTIFSECLASLGVVTA